MINTAESVTAWHPDKICDQISDAILDECLKQDPMSRVAVETMGGHGKIFLTGEITTKALVNYKLVAKEIYRDLLNKNIEVFSNIVSQAPEIAQGVNKGGAGDQGIMIGYACNENYQKIPQELYIARRLLKPYKTDAKSQVTLNGHGIKKIVLSVQGKEQQDLIDHIDTFMAMYYPSNTFPEVYCNNTGSFITGGFDADSGVTGRKIVVDAYGPRVPVGGGAFSGKDATKVDRSAAYMARWIALKEQKNGSKEVLIKIAYVIGKIEPIMVAMCVEGVEYDISKEYDCRPEAIIERFDLRKPIYRDLSKNGHFGRNELAWEKII
jgi:S-adenosylmethionine synthetase